MHELHIVARQVLLDALEALGAHSDAVVVVGAQAVYLRAGDADLAVAPHTTDGDLVLDPDRLGEIPPLEEALVDADFTPAGGSAVGVWFARRPTASMPDVSVQVDLLVPRMVSPGRGRRAARLPGHEPKAARIVRGLEGALVDADIMAIGALDPSDTRTLDARVAGPAALLVAKMHKIDERRGTTRANDKDALDVLRLLRGVSTEDLAERMTRVLADERSARVGQGGLHLLRTLFGPGGEGVEMAVRALSGVMEPAEVRLACELLSDDLVRAVPRS